MIKERITQVEIQPLQKVTHVGVSVGELVLYRIGTHFNLDLITETGTHGLCHHFQRLGNVNKYARCYGIEFVKGW